MKLFEGVCTALATPYDKNGINYSQLKRILDYQLDNKVNAVLVNGSTAEPELLTAQEQFEQIKFVINYVNEKIPVLVGCGEPSTINTLYKCEMANELGADALLVVTPFYNKTSQEGVYEHYKFLSDNLRAPIIIYNVPSRTGFNMLPKTVEKISKLDNIIGLKEASGNIIQAMELYPYLNDKFSLYCGDDALTIAMKAVGASGVISVASNIYPRLVARAYYYADPSLNYALKTASDILFCETNPIPLKYMMQKTGLTEEYFLRLPLVKLSEEKMRFIDEKMPFLEEYI